MMKKRLIYLLFIIIFIHLTLLLLSSSICYNNDSNKLYKAKIDFLFYFSFSKQKT